MQVGRRSSVTLHPGFLTNYQCPLCGHRLYTDNLVVWCSKVTHRACGYGVYEDVELAQVADKLTKYEPRRRREVARPALFLVPAVL